jgi:hypothetical protein
MKAWGGIQLNDHCDDLTVDVVFRHACKLGFEGIVSKRRRARVTYRRAYRRGYRRAYHRGAYYRPYTYGHYWRVHRRVVRRAYRRSTTEERERSGTAGRGMDAVGFTTKTARKNLPGYAPRREAAMRAFAKSLAAGVDKPDRALGHSHAS